MKVDTVKNKWRSLLGLGIFRTLGLLLLTLAFFVACNEQATPSANIEKEADMNNSVLSNSLENQVRLVFPKQSSAKKVDLVPLPSTLSAPEINAPVVAFLAPDSGHAWVGYQHDTYIQLDSGIVGLLASEPGFIQWRLSTVHNAKSKDELLAAIPTQEELVQTLSEHEKTDIRDVFADGDFFFAGPGLSNHVQIELLGITLESGLLKIELKNPTASRQGIVFIDPETREAKKAFENGKQTFPKSQ